MTIEHTGLPAAGAFCETCGTRLNGEFCEACGTASMADVAEHPVTRDPDGAPVDVRRPAEGPSRRRRIKTGTAVIIAATLGLMALAVLTVLLIAKDRESAPGAGPSLDAVYQEKVAAALAPLLAADRELSTTLTGISGARTRPARRAVRAAQRASAASAGAVRALTASPDSRDTEARARQLLDREDAFLSAVAAVLRDPSTPSRNELITLQSNLQSAVTAVGTGVERDRTHLTGAIELAAWAPRAVRARRRAHAAKRARSVAASTSQAGASAATLPAFTDYRGPAFEAKLPSGSGWSAPAQSEPTPGRLFRTSVRGPAGAFVIVDFTPYEPASFGGVAESTRTVGQTAFGSATEYVFEGGRLPECQRSRCIDYLINDAATGQGFAVLAGGPDFASASVTARTVIESVTPSSEYGA